MEIKISEDKELNQVVMNVILPLRKRERIEFSVEDAKKKMEEEGYEFERLLTYHVPNNVSDRRRIGYFIFQLKEKEEKKEEKPKKKRKKIKKVSEDKPKSKRKVRTKKMPARQEKKDLKELTIPTGSFTIGSGPIYPNHSSGSLGD